MTCVQRVEATYELRDNAPLAESTAAVRMEMVKVPCNAPQVRACSSKAVGALHSGQKRPRCERAQHANDFDTIDTQLAHASDVPMFAAPLQELFSARRPTDPTLGFGANATTRL